MAALMKYLIVDDEEIDRMAIETQADKFPFLHKIAACSNPIEALELIHQFKPDIIFADIEMPGMTGLELVRCLSGLVPAPVFITSFPDFALEGYEMEAFDYLLKPLNPERFARCVLRLRDFFELRAKAFAFDKDQETDSIIIKQGYDKHKISLHEILYLEAMKDYMRIVTASRQYLILGTLTSMHDSLPPEKFIRIHRSFIVRRDRIESIKGNRLFLQNYELPVGKIYKHLLNEILQ